MSHYDYELSKQIAGVGAPFAALVMAAYRKADSGNADLLERAFPAIITELQTRYDEPGGWLRHEVTSTR